MSHFVQLIAGLLVDIKRVLGTLGYDTSGSGSGSWLERVEERGAVGLGR